MKTTELDPSTAVAIPVTAMINTQEALRAVPTFHLRPISNYYKFHKQSLSAPQRAFPTL